jgi:predicted Zn-dependent protease
MGIAPALVVKGGEIKGRAGGLMISGNLYEVMKDVTAVENELHPTFGAISL